MDRMEESRSLPNRDQLSVLVAVILFIYALTSFMNLPEAHLSMQLPGFFLSIPVYYRNLVSLAASVLAASGMDTILRSHPAYDGSPTAQHWVLPALTTWVIGLALATLTNAPSWWLVFGLGAVLLPFSFIAEYILLDETNPLIPLAAAGSIALAFTLFLILGIALQASGSRLFLILPAVTIASGMVSLRAIHLRTGKKTDYAWSIGVALATLQVAAGFHYLPLPPIPYSLLLTGVVFSLTALASALIQGKKGWRVAIEPGVLLILFGLIAVLVH